MQVTQVQEKTYSSLGTAVLFIGIGVAAVLVVALISGMGLLPRVFGGETAVAAEEGQLTLTTKDMRFGPDEIRVKAGETVTLQLNNDDLYAHSFDLDEFDVHAPLAANGQNSVTFTPTQPGTYRFYCGIPGHEDAGMVGTIIVEK